MKTSAFEICPKSPQKCKNTKLKYTLSQSSLTAIVTKKTFQVLTALNGKKQQNPRPRFIRYYKYAQNICFEFQKSASHEPILHGHIYNKNITRCGFRANSLGGGRWRSPNSNSLFLFLAKIPTH
ncbi:MAG: hypothetical protein GY928_32120 [Colwellia sp.]|nr:hypothetical protein [Colwellia sp.]